MAFILALIHWLKPSADEGGEETGVTGENPRGRTSENFTQIYESPKIPAPTETRTCTLALVAGAC